MTQHDYNLVNQAGSLFRSDLNNALLATVTHNSGDTEPTTMYAHMFWMDTTTGKLKQRNTANTAWIEVLTTVNMHLATTKNPPVALDEFIVADSENGYALRKVLWSSMQAPAAFPSGTRMFFQQLAAPTGWTKDYSTTFNNSAMRVVSSTGGSVLTETVVGTGGTDLFTTLFGTSKSSASYTLTITDMPTHNHGGATGGQSASHYHSSYSSGPTGVRTDIIQGYAASNNTSNTGWASNDHTHPISSQGSGGGHAHTLSNMNLKYTDTIIAQKD